MKHKFRSFHTLFRRLYKKPNLMGTSSIKDIIHRSGSFILICKDHRGNLNERLVTLSSRYLDTSYDGKVISVDGCTYMLVYSLSPITNMYSIEIVSL